MLVALCLAVYLPGLIATPPIDRDEARFAQASRQMLESVTLPASDLDTRPFEFNSGTVSGGFHAGGLVVPMVQDVPRLNKPPMIYWLQAASAWVCSGGDVLSDAIWMYRVPSALGSIAAVLAMWWMGRRMFHPSAALLGASLLAVSAVVVFDAHQARADQVLLGLTTWAMAVLWSIVRRAYHGRRIGAGRWLALWVLVGLGVLVKGLSPIVVLLTLAAMGILGRQWFAWRAARPILGLAVVALVVAPWIVALAGHIGLSTYLDVLFDETVARGGSAKEGHAGPPGYHLLALLATFWPGTIFVALGAWWGWRRGLAIGPSGARWSGRRTGRLAELFLVCWIVPTWVFFELYSTKLPHYVLPTYPAVALLTARALLASPAVLMRWPARAGVAVFTLIGLGLPLGGVVLTFTLEPVSRALWLIIPLAGVMCVLVAFAARRAWSGRAIAAAPIAVCAMIPLAVIIHAAAIPSLTRFSPRLVAQIAEHDDGTRPIACAGYHEDSLIFLMRGRIERVVHTDTAKWLDEHPTGLLLARRLYRDDGGLDDSYTTLVSLTGFQFASSEFVTVDFVENPE